ncbi:MAG: hypothetical protein QW767_04605 [Thermoprotei archaeon]
MTQRERVFWEGYALIEAALSVPPNRFEGKSLRSAVEGMTRCASVIESVIFEIYGELHEKVKPEVRDSLWELGRKGLIDANLLSDLLDVYSVCRMADQGKLDSTRIYSELVRVMEILEAGWKHLELKLEELRTNTHEVDGNVGSSSHRPSNA